MVAAFSAVKLQSLYTRAGFKCELDAGHAGIVVYAASAAVATIVAMSLAGALDTKNVKSEFIDYGFDADEPSETAYAKLVAFDWGSL